MYTIVKREVLSEAVFLFDIEAAKIAAKAKPGFFILRLDEKGERIPLTIAYLNAEHGTITTIFQVVGRTTRDMSKLNESDEILDVVGSLGEPSKIGKYGCVVCVGGGVGIAPIYSIVKVLKEVDNEVISIICARNKGFLFWQDKMAKVSDRLIVCTDDGSYGQKGFVTQAIEQVAKEKEINHLWAIGPMPMMKAVANTTKPLGIKTVVSLNLI